MDFTRSRMKIWCQILFGSWLEYYFTYPLFVRDSVAYIATGYGLEGLEFESSVLVSFFGLIQTSTEVHATPCKMGTYLFPGDTAGEWTPTTHPPSSALVDMLGIWRDSFNFNHFSVEEDG